MIDILNRVRFYAKLSSNKSLPILRREEGGLGGDDNTINKQIRFRSIFCDIVTNNGEIELDQICNTPHEQWTHRELDDLIQAFVLTFNELTKCRAVRGYIVLIPDDYSDRDDD